MVFRRFLSLLAAIALLLGGVHSVAMATEMAVPPAVSAATDMPCHVAEQEAEPQKSPAKADCCPGDCNGACTPSAALFGTAWDRPVLLLPVAPDALVLTAAPSARSKADERPPKTWA